MRTPRQGCRTSKSASLLTIVCPPKRARQLQILVVFRVAAVRHALSGLEENPKRDELAEQFRTQVRFEEPCHAGPMQHVQQLGHELLGDRDSILTQPTLHYLAGTPWLLKVA